MTMLQRVGFKKLENYRISNAVTVNAAALVAFACCTQLDATRSQRPSAILTWQASTPTHAERLACTALITGLKKANLGEKRSIWFDRAHLPAINSIDWKPLAPATAENVITAVNSYNLHNHKFANLNKPSMEELRHAKIISSQMIEEKIVRVDHAEVIAEGHPVILYRVRWIGWSGGTLSRAASNASKTENFSAIVEKSPHGFGNYGLWPIYSAVYPSLSVFKSSNEILFFDNAQLQVRRFDLLSDNDQLKDDAICSLSLGSTAR